MTGSDPIDPVDEAKTILSNSSSLSNGDLQRMYAKLQQSKNRLQDDIKLLGGSENKNLTEVLIDEHHRLRAQANSSALQTMLDQHNKNILELEQGQAEERDVLLDQHEQDYSDASDSEMTAVEAKHKTEEENQDLKFKEELDSLIDKQVGELLAIKKQTEEKAQETDRMLQAVGSHMSIEGNLISEVFSENLREKLAKLLPVSQASGLSPDSRASDVADDAVKQPFRIEGALKKQLAIWNTELKKKGDFMLPRSHLEELVEQRRELSDDLDNAQRVLNSYVPDISIQFQKLGRQHDEQRKQFSQSAGKTIETLLRENDSSYQELVTKLINEQQKLYTALLNNYCNLYPELIDRIRDLSATIAQINEVFSLDIKKREEIQRKSLLPPTAFGHRRKRSETVNIVTNTDAQFTATERMALDEEFKRGVWSVAEGAVKAEAKVVCKKFLGESGVEIEAVVFRLFNKPDGMLTSKVKKMLGNEMSQALKQQIVDNPNKVTLDELQSNSQLSLPSQSSPSRKKIRQ